MTKPTTTPPAAEDFTGPENAETPGTPQPAPGAMRMTAARKLVQTAIECERRAAHMERARDEHRRVWEAADGAASVMIRQASRAWSVARLALRCVARGEAMPANAGDVQLCLEDVFTVPADAKAGDTLVDPRSGARYVIRATREGALFAFPQTQEGNAHA